MSLTTWTPDALLSEIRPFRSQAWRVVEAQHIKSTMRLVDSISEQQILEEELEASKPDIPEECRHLYYLLATPFRYRPYPHGSRFRRAGATPGVWYGAEEPATAIAEIVFYRFLFFAESPETKFPNSMTQYTAFAADLDSDRSLDLTSGELTKDHHHWEELSAYEACQELADNARALDIEVLRYKSVRDLDGGMNVAVLSGNAFSDSNPSEGVVDQQTWHIQIDQFGGHVICEAPRLRRDFPPDAFNADKRLSDMNWRRS